MVIKELSIENFRGIKNLVIPLDRNGAVFYGINGAGKSTVIKVVNLLISRVLDKVSLGRFKNAIKIKEEDVSYGSSATKIIAKIHLVKRDFTLSRSYDKKKRMGYISKENSEIGELLRTELEINESFELPIFVVYGVNRSVVDIPLRIRDKHSFDRIAAYERSSTGTDFRVFFEWYRNQEDYENQIRANNDHSYQDPQLQAVREAIYALMPGFSQLMVERKPKLRMVISKDNMRLAIDQLSDGEKCYIAMIGDLARRMAVANPHAKHPLNCSGIVLIDEVELHLHPEWQRRIVPSLRQTFPNIQLIITTHSPQVLGEIKDMDIIKLLKQDGMVVAQKVLSTFGRNSDFILEQFMDAPEKNVGISERIENMYRYINSKNYDEAERITKELSNVVGNDDADVIKARVLIARGKAKDETNHKE